MEPVRQTHRRPSGEWGVNFSERFLKEPGRTVRSFPMQKFKSTRERRALAKVRAEVKLRRWREAHEYAERVYLRMVKRLRVEREARGLTMYEVEMASGLSREMVARMETGRSVPSLIVLGKVARAFRVPLPKLLVALCARCRR